MEQGDSDRRAHLVHKEAGNTVVFLILNDYIISFQAASALFRLPENIL